MIDIIRAKLRRDKFQSSVEMGMSIHSQSTVKGAFYRLLATGEAKCRMAICEDISGRMRRSMTYALGAPETPEEIKCMVAAQVSVDKKRKLCRDADREREKMRKQKRMAQSERMRMDPMLWITAGRKPPRISF
ncbi:hypothetical protein [Petrachloros mirabilis]